MMESKKESRGLVQMLNMSFVLLRAHFWAMSYLKDTKKCWSWMVLCGKKILIAHDSAVSEVDLIVMFEKEIWHWSTGGVEVAWSQIPSGRDKAITIVMNRWWETGKQLCWKGSGDSGCQWVEHESTACPGSQKGQLYPVVHQAQHY